MIQNSIQTDLSSFVLEDHVAKYGPPHEYTKDGAPTKLNENFWASLEAEFNNIIQEKNEDELYQFDGKIYQLYSKYDMMGQVSNDMMWAENAWADLYPGVYQLNQAQKIESIIKQFKAKVSKKDPFERLSQIAVNNGILELDSENQQITLRDFSPEFFNRNLIPIDFEPKARCPEFESQMLVLLDPDDRLMLQKFAGVFLLGCNILQKILILHGLGDTGKSTTAEILRQLIGVRNCCGLRTAHLDERFEASSYLGKTLLIGVDVKPDFLSSGGAAQLKSLVGGDQIPMEFKNSNHRFYVPGHFNALTTSNTRLVIQLNEDRKSWERRLAIIEYDKERKSKTIHGYAGILIRKEGSGILNWGLDGYHGDAFSDLRMPLELESSNFIGIASRQFHGSAGGSMAHASDAQERLMSGGRIAEPGHRMKSSKITASPSRSGQSGVHIICHPFTMISFFNVNEAGKSIAEHKERTWAALVAESTALHSRIGETAC
jgi:phage/plasmid-associated DNA primase